MPRRQAATATLALATLALALDASGIAVPTAAFASASTGTRVARRVPSTSKVVGYPFAASRPPKVDPWGASVRQCTSFASWWLTTHGMKITSSTGIRGPRGSAILGSAAHWEAAALQAGFRVSGKPAVGAIAQCRSYERSTWSIPGGYRYVLAGPEGHVGVVLKVYSDGTALIEDYNGAVPLGQHSFHGKAPRYLMLRG